jgi:imidazolonepropionase-like amidohydrolase
VVFEGSVIASVAFGADAFADIDGIDLGEATLLPGLVDTHVHLASMSSTAR